MSGTRTVNDLWAWLMACVTCGRPHAYRTATQCDQGWRHAGTWADPTDGHAYRRRDLRDLEAVRAQWDFEGQKAP